MTRFLLSHVLACLSMGAIFPVHAQTLNEAVGLALPASPDANASISRRLAAEQQVSQARGGFLPKVDAHAGYGWQHLDTAQSRLLDKSHDVLWRQAHGVSLTQMLFDGDVVRSDVDQARARLDSASYRVSSVTENQVLQVVGAYLEVLRRTETLGLASENLAQHERIYDLIRKRTDSGVGRRADLEQADARLALARASLRQERGFWDDAQTVFIRLMRRVPQSLQMPYPPMEGFPGTRAAAIDAALERNPGIKAAQSDLAAAFAQREGARAGFWPRVDLELQSTHDRNAVIGRSYDSTALVRLRYNLFRGGADEARVRETAYLIDEAKHLIERIRRESEETVAIALSAYATARERNVELERYVRASEATREAYTGQFNIGQRSLLDLLNAENELFSARLARTTGFFTEMAGVYRVWAGIGILRETLQRQPEKSAALRIEPVTKLLEIDATLMPPAMPVNVRSQDARPGWVLGR
ncbi:MAG: TolC family outer membrane protein [Burkholderiales bacterium]